MKYTDLTPGTSVTTCFCNNCVTGPHYEDEPKFYWQELDNDNVHDLTDSAYSGYLFGIVSEKDGGIIAYANGEDHANEIVDALNNQK